MKTVIGGGEKTLYNFDKRRDHAKLHAKAAARLTDYIKIHAIFSDPAFIKGEIYTVPLKVGVNTGLNEEKYALAIAYLESQGMDVHDLQVSTWAPALLKPSLYGDEKVNNFFYNDVKPLTNNKVKVYLDIDFRFLGENGINSIPRVPDQEGLSIDFLKAYLPQEIYKTIEINTLQLTEKSFIVPELKEIHSDIIYKCQINQKSGYLFFLVEHASTAKDELMAFRLLHYIVSLSYEHLQQGHKKLPIILPLCIYHGEISPYPHSTTYMITLKTLSLLGKWLLSPLNS